MTTIKYNYTYHKFLFPTIQYAESNEQFLFLIPASFEA